MGSTHDFDGSVDGLSVNDQAPKVAAAPLKQPIAANEFAKLLGADLSATMVA
jgi:hypothetical protein